MAFFIMKKINFILFFSFLFSFYNFDSDDWFFVSKPDRIKSITQDSFSVYFLADNGIYTYDYMNDKIFYNIDLSYGLADKEKQYIYYHPLVDYFFVITDDQILYKASVNFYWNKKNFSSLNINSFLSIDKIGFSDKYLVIYLNNTYKIIDLFTMNLIDSDINELNNIHWLDNNSDNLDLSSFYTLDNTLISSDYIRDISNITHLKTCSMYDSHDNLWIGMNTGAIYKVDDFSYEIQRVNIGPNVDYVSNIYNDNSNNWYFFDNYFRRTGEYMNFNNEGYFLSIWNEKQDVWTHISRNEDILVSDIIINDIMRIKDFILFSTINGLIIYNLKTDSWFHEETFLNTYDKSLWTMKADNDKLYFATTSGIIVCNYLIIDNQLKVYYDTHIFKNNEIYDIDINEDIIYFSSEKGLYKYNNNLSLLDLNIYYNIEAFNSYVLASNRNLWYIDNSGKHLLSSNVIQFSSYEGNKICATDFNEIKMINFESKDEWYLNLNKLNINEPIYSINCDNEWLWFSNPNGISFFKWDTYEN